MAIVNTILVENNPGLAAIGAGLGTGLTALGTGLGTGLAGAGTGLGAGITGAATALAGSIAGSAVTSAASVAAEWIQRLALPAVQAIAQIKILDYQRAQYEKISDKQVGYVDDAINNYVSKINSAVTDARNGSPEPPKAAAYIPVNWCDIQQQVLGCGTEDAVHIGALVKQINLQHRAEQLSRVYALSVGWQTSMQLFEAQYTDLMRGKLPVSDVVEVMTDTAEQACLNGRVGRTCNQTLLNLGISQMRAQVLGRNEMARHLEIMERISPVGKLMDGENFILKPDMILRFSLAQAQLVQASLQNVYNAQTAGDPRALAAAQVKLAGAVAQLQGAVTKANLVNSYVPNFAGVLQPALQSFTEGLFGTGNSTYGRNSNGTLGKTGTNLGFIGSILGV
jgi:hypothetical protein